MYNESIWRRQLLMEHFNHQTDSLVGTVHSW